MPRKMSKMMAIILWAHRQRLSDSQTHKAPAAAVACCRGTAASKPQSTRRGQALPPDLRRTRPTLTNIAPPNRLPTQKPLQPKPRSMPPLTGYPVPAGGHGRPRPRLEWRNPKACPALPRHRQPRNKMRPAMPAPRQKAATLRRSICFRCGRLGAALRSARLRALSACRRCTTLHIFPKAPSTRLTLRYAWPPLLASSRPCGKPYARPSTSPSGMRPIVVPFPRRGTAFAR